MPKRCDHIIVRHLPKIVVEGANRSDRPYIGKTYDVVHFVAQGFQRIGWSDRNGQHELARTAYPSRLQSGPHGRAGRDAVINHDDDATFHVEWLTPPDIDNAPPLDLGKLLPARGPEIPLRSWPCSR